MIAEALGISEEELSRALAQAYYGDPFKELKFLDMVALAMKSYSLALTLVRRMDEVEGIGKGEWLPIKDVQNFLGISRATIHRHIKSKTFESKKIGGRTYVKVGDAYAYLTYRGGMRPQRRHVFAQAAARSFYNAKQESSKNGADTRCGPDGTQPEVHPEPPGTLNNPDATPEPPAAA